jgi:hypothetical protein
MAVALPRSLGWIDRRGCSPVSLMGGLIGGEPPNTLFFSSGRGSLALLSSVLKDEAVDWGL